MSKDIGHLDGRHRARGYCFCGGAASGHKKLIKERAKVVFQDSDDGFDAGHQLRIMGRLGEVVVFSQENGIKVAIASVQPIQNWAFTLLKLSVGEGSPMQER